jgi:molybdate transport system ATP-binding protein
MNNLKYDLDFTMTLGLRTIKVKLQSSSNAVSLQAPSGSGKSSFIRSLLGLHKKIQGKCLVSQKNIGYVPQDSLLIPTMTVTENLFLSPRAKRTHFDEITQALSISHLLERYPRMLSGGEKQRVSIGRALLSEPELLILDEPFAALDFSMRTSLATFLKAWIDKNKIDLILVTHDENSSLLMCQEFWQIQNEEIIFNPRA